MNHRYLRDNDGCAALLSTHVQKKPARLARLVSFSRGSFLPLPASINTETLPTQRRWIHPQFFNERILEPVLSEVGVFRHDELDRVRVPWCSSTAWRRVAWLPPGRHQRFTLVWHGLRPIRWQSAREVHLRRLIQHEKPRNQHALLPGVVVLSGDVIRQQVRAAPVQSWEQGCRVDDHHRYENKS